MRQWPYLGWSIFPVGNIPPHLAALTEIDVRRVYHRSRLSGSLRWKRSSSRSGTAQLRPTFSARRRPSRIQRRTSSGFRWSRSATLSGVRYFIQ